MNLIMQEKTRKNRQLSNLIRLLLILSSIVLIQTVSLPLKASHQTIQSIKTIREAAIKFLYQQHAAISESDIQITLGNIDSRIRLAQCDSPIEAFLPQSSNGFGKTTVGVRCTSKTKWKVFIAAEVQIFDTFWVTKKALSKNDIIQQQDLIKQRIRVDNLRKKPIRDIALINGTRPTKRIPIKGVIYQDEICMVCKNDKVTVTVGNQFFNITAEGIALANAKIGETVAVKNTRSKQVFTAIVTSRDKLNVKLSGNKNL
jgi:flagella basal body P-ring formation protein FlgA